MPLFGLRVVLETMVQDLEHIEKTLEPLSSEAVLEQICKPDLQAKVRAILDYIEARKDAYMEEV